MTGNLFFASQSVTYKAKIQKQTLINGCMLFFVLLRTAQLQWEKKDKKYLDDAEASTSMTFDFDQ